MMYMLQRKNQEQMRDISAQLQSGLLAFLKQSLENMFTRLAPAQANTAPPSLTALVAQPHIVSMTPVSAKLPATKPEEPMDSTPSHPLLHSNHLYKHWHRRIMGLIHMHLHNPKVSY